MKKEKNTVILSQCTYFNFAFFSTASKYAENDEVLLTKVPDTYDLEFINEMTLRERILLD